MELLLVDSLDEAIKKLYNVFKNSKNSFMEEEVLVEDSYNRILVNDFVANNNVPEFNRSSVDGYAVIASDTSGASESGPTFLTIIGESKMGEECKFELKNGEAVYVPTGAMIPKNATAVVMVEYTENLTDEKIAIYNSVADGLHVVKIGDDLKKGDVVVKKGKVLSYADIGALSSVGAKKINVYKKINVSIISTGDELIKYDDDYDMFKVRDINTNLLCGLCYKYNFNIINKFLIKDNEEELKKVISEEKKYCDIILISGGSSKGKKDATAVLINDLCDSKVITHGLAVKPGKPTITGYDAKSNTFIFGLPGHPVASAIIFNILVIEVIYMILCDKEMPLKKKCNCYISENIPSSAGRKTFQLVKIDENNIATPIFGRSGLIHTLSFADGYIVIDELKEGLNKNEEVIVYYL